MVLRCHRCHGKFTLRDLPMERLTSLPLVAVCPHCGARPEIAPANQHSKMHRVFDLRCDGAAKKSAA
jgi:DNA-directed RNA polymerase subunit RPC12/RpoP